MCLLLGGSPSGGCLLLRGVGSPGGQGASFLGVSFQGASFLGGASLFGGVPPSWGGSPSLEGCLLLGGVSFFGGAYFLGGLLLGASLLGGLLPGGLLVRGCLLLGDLPVDRITDTSKNITLATTSLQPVIIITDMMAY